MNVVLLAEPLLGCDAAFFCRVECGARYDKLITVMDKNNKSGGCCGSTTKCDDKSKATTTKRPEANEKPKK